MENQYARGIRCNNFFFFQRAFKSFHCWEQRSEILPRIWGLDGWKSCLSVRAFVFPIIESFKLNEPFKRNELLILEELFHSRSWLCLMSFELLKPKFHQSNIKISSWLSVASWSSTCHGHPEAIDFRPRLSTFSPSNCLKINKKRNNNRLNGCEGTQWKKIEESPDFLGKWEEGISARGLDRIEFYQFIYIPFVSRAQEEFATKARNWISGSKWVFWEWKAAWEF